MVTIAGTPSTQSNKGLVKRAKAGLERGVKIKYKDEKGRVIKTSYKKKSKSSDKVTTITEPAEQQAIELNLREEQAKAREETIKAIKAENARLMAERKREQAREFGQIVRAEAQTDTQIKNYVSSVEKYQAITGKRYNPNEEAKPIDNRPLLTENKTEQPTGFASIIISSARDYSKRTEYKPGTTGLTTTKELLETSKILGAKLVEWNPQLNTIALAEKVRPTTLYDAYGKVYRTDAKQLFEGFKSWSRKYATDEKILDTTGKIGPYIQQRPISALGDVIGLLTAGKEIKIVSEIASSIRAGKSGYTITEVAPGTEIHKGGGFTQYEAKFKYETFSRRGKTVGVTRVEPFSITKPSTWTDTITGKKPGTIKTFYPIAEDFIIRDVPSQYINPKQEASIGGTTQTIISVSPDTAWIKKSQKSKTGTYDVLPGGNKQLDTLKGRGGIGGSELSQFYSVEAVRDIPIGAGEKATKGTPQLYLYYSGLKSQGTYSDLLRGEASLSLTTPKPGFIFQREKINLVTSDVIQSSSYPILSQKTAGLTTPGTIYPSGSSLKGWRTEAEGVKSWYTKTKLSPKSQTLYLEDTGFLEGFYGRNIRSYSQKEYKTILNKNIDVLKGRITRSKELMASNPEEWNLGLQLMERDIANIKFIDKALGTTTDISLELKELEILKNAKQSFFKTQRTELSFSDYLDKELIKDVVVKTKSNEEALISNISYKPSKTISVGRIVFDVSKPSKLVSSSKSFNLSNSLSVPSKASSSYSISNLSVLSNNGRSKPSASKSNINISSMSTPSLVSPSISSPSLPSPSAPSPSSPSISSPSLPSPSAPSPSSPSISSPSLPSPSAPSPSSPSIIKPINTPRGSISYGDENKSSKKKKEKGLYDIMIGSPGKFVYKKFTGLTLEEAKTIGRQQLRSTAAAGLSISREGKRLNPSELKDISSSLGREYSLSQSQKGIIQLPQYRITTAGEKKQIPLRSKDLRTVRGFRQALSLVNKGRSLRNIRRGI